MRAARTGQGHSHVGRIGVQPCRRRTRRPPSGRAADAAVVDDASPTHEDWTRRQRSRSTSVLTLASTRASGWTTREGINAGRSPGAIAHRTRCITPVLEHSTALREPRLSGARAHLTCPTLGLTSTTTPSCRVRPHGSARRVSTSDCSTSSAPPADPSGSSQMHSRAPAASPPDVDARTASSCTDLEVACCEPVDREEVCLDL